MLPDSRGQRTRMATNSFDREMRNPHQLLNRFLSTNRRSLCAHAGDDRSKAANVSKGNVDSHVVSFTSQIALRLGADAVKHLKLKFRLTDLMNLCVFLSPRRSDIIMR